MAELFSAAGTGSTEEFLKSLKAALVEIYSSAPGTNIDAIFQAYARQLADVDIEALSVKSDEIISLTVTDELKARGLGTYDRLSREGAFELVGIRYTPTISLRREPNYLTVGSTTLPLRYKPTDGTSIKLYNKDTEVEVSGEISYNTETNEITFDAISEAATYIAEYLDNGTVTTSSEALSIPEILINLGYGVIPYGELGYGF